VEREGIVGGGPASEEESVLAEVGAGGEVVVGEGGCADVDGRGGCAASFRKA
jgi:hypothetical protein